MAKKVTGYIKLQIPAGKATPAPPVGPALGQHGVNIVEFTKQFIEEPTNPATILAIHPIDFPLLVIAPAIAPMMAPIIKTHNQCIKHHPLLFFEGCFLDLL